ncbi:hypothetical protein THAOC_01782, partial [Thalassiosira oceanica]
TELEAILLDMTGLSVGKQIHAHAVVKPYDEAVIATGGLGCAGYLLNQVKTAAETGFQDHLTESGMYHVGDEMEQLDSGVLGLAFAEQRASDVHERHDIELSWEPGRLKDCPEKFEEVTKVVADAVNGKGRWIDPFRDQVPVPGAETFEDCHAWRKFSEHQCKGAIENTVADVFVPAEMNGGFYIVDVNNAAFRKRPRVKKRKRAQLEDDDDDLDCSGKMPEICQFLLERDTSSSFGASKGSAPKWKIWLDSYKRFWRKYGFILMRLICPDKKPRVIVLICPPSDNVQQEGRPDGLRRDAEVSPTSSVPGYHGMELREGHEYITGSSARKASFLLGDQERDDSVEIESDGEDDEDIDDDDTTSTLSGEEKKAKRVSDRKLLRKAICLLQNSNPGDVESWERSIRACLHYIGHKEDGTPQTPGDRSARFARLMKSGYLIEGSTTENWIRSEYDGALDNLGNRTSADKDGGQPFDPVAIDGQEIIYKEYGRYSKKNTVIKTHRGRRFRLSEFVPGITWLGLLERVNKLTNGPGTTKRAKTEKLSDYEVDVDLTVCRAMKSRSVEHHNNLGNKEDQLVRYHLEDDTPPGLLFNDPIVEGGSLRMDPCEGESYLSITVTTECFGVHHFSREAYRSERGGWGGARRRGRRTQQSTAATERVAVVDASRDATRGPAARAQRPRGSAPGGHRHHVSQLVLSVNIITIGIIITITIIVTSVVPASGIPGLWCTGVKQLNNLHPQRNRIIGGEQKTAALPRRRHSRRRREARIYGSIRVVKHQCWRPSSFNSWIRAPRPPARAGALTDGGASLIDSAAAAASSSRHRQLPQRGVQQHSRCCCSAPWPNEGNSTQKERCRLAFEYEQFVDEHKHAATEGDEDERKPAAKRMKLAPKKCDEDEADDEATSPGRKHDRGEGKPRAKKRQRKESEVDDSEENAARAGGRKRSGKKAKKDSSSKKKKKRKKEKLPGEPWEFRTAERAAGPPRPIPQKIELAIPYHPADPPSVIERTIVLQSDDKHLRELNGPGVTVYIRRDDEVDQFQLVGKPVLSNVPRSVSFAEGGDGQLVLQLSTRVHECITTFSGSPSWSWREEDAVPDSAVDVVAAIHSARELHDVIKRDYGIVVNLPELKFPSAEELVSARDDLDAMAGHLGRVMDQYHLLTVVETVLQRCVANYMKITERRYLQNQEREKARAAEERRRAGVEDSGVNHDQADDTVLSYGALHERFRNSVQQEAVDDYIETLARPMFRMLRDNGSVMTHGCHGNGDFDYAAQDIDTVNPVLYFAHPQHKSGSASQGRLKKEVLTERYVGRGQEKPKFYKAIDLANIPPGFQKSTMTPFLLKQLERFMCPRPPKTELEAILLDMTGLSVGKQIHAHAVVKPYDEAVIATGGRGCAGYLLNQVKTAAETGFQDHLTESGGVLG